MVILVVVDNGDGNDWLFRFPRLISRLYLEAPRLTDESKMFLKEYCEDLVMYILLTVMSPSF
jgi:hypothetical protein